MPSAKPATFLLCFVYWCYDYCLLLPSLYNLLRVMAFSCWPDPPLDSKKSGVVAAIVRTLYRFSQILLEQSDFIGFYPFRFIPFVRTIHPVYFSLIFKGGILLLATTILSSFFVFFFYFQILTLVAQKLGTSYSTISNQLWCLRPQATDWN